MGSPVPNARRRLLSYYGPDSCPITTYLLPPFTAHTKHTFLLPLVRELLPVWTRIIFSLPFRRLEFATTQYSPSPEDSVVRSQDATWNNTKYQLLGSTKTIQAVGNSPLYFC